MPRPSYFDIDPADVDADGIAEAQTIATGGASLTLNGALCDAGTAAQFDIGDAYSAGIGGVQIVVTPTASESANFTVTGKNQDGEDVTEVIAITTNTAVESTTYWSQITAIAADAGTTTDISVGTVDEIVSRVFPLNWRNREPATYVVSGLTGTISYNIEETFDNTATQASTALNWIDHTATAGADAARAGTLHARGVRIKSNSYTNGAEFQFGILQN